MPLAGTLPITVIIPTKNEDKNIRDCLASVAWADQVFGYEPDPQRSAQRGKELEINATSDLDSILNDPTIQLIYIAAPNDVHVELAIKSMRAGKSVLCEKPMAT